MNFLIGCVVAQVVMLALWAAYPVPVILVFVPTIAAVVVFTATAVVMALVLVSLNR